MAKRSRDESPSPSPNLPPLEGDVDRAIPKYTQTNGNGGADRSRLMRCLLPPHKPISFSSYEEYDSHYQQTHVNRCSQCHKNFPSTHFTTIHIAENHDPLNESRKARGDKIYACFVEDCDKICSTPQKRRMHLVDKHHFPKNYNFFIVNDGLDRRKSMLRPNFQHRRRASSLLDSVQQDHAPSPLTKSRATVHPRSTDGPIVNHVGDADADSELSEEEEHFASPEPPDDAEAFAPVTQSAEEDMDDITKSMSALRFVPQSVRFGRGRGRGFARR